MFCPCKLAIVCATAILATNVSLGQQNASIKNSKFSLSSSRLTRHAEGGHANFPYVVKVISVYECSGVIIHPFWVLTAAHCFGSSKSAQVHWDKEVLDSKNVLIHPDYVSVLEPGTVTLGTVDLALVQLAERIHFSTSVNKIELDGYGWPQDRNTYNRSCLAVGVSRHRATSAEEDYVHGTLFNAEHGDNACACLPQKLKQHLVCLKGREETFCAEDLGGPLVCNNKLTAVLHTLYDLNSCKLGTAESVPACDSRNSMGVCMYICPYLNWIKHYVPGVPPRPLSCRSSLHFSHSVLVALSYFLSCYYTSLYYIFILDRLV